VAAQRGTVFTRCLGNHAGRTDCTGMPGEKFVPIFTAMQILRVRTCCEPVAVAPPVDRGVVSQHLSTQTVVAVLVSVEAFALWTSLADAACEVNIAHVVSSGDKRFSGRLRGASVIFGLCRLVNVANIVICMCALLVDVATHAGPLFELPCLPLRRVKRGELLAAAGFLAVLETLARERVVVAHKPRAAATINEEGVTPASKVHTIDAAFLGIMLVDLHTARLGHRCQRRHTREAIAHCIPQRQRFLCAIRRHCHRAAERRATDVRIVLLWHSKWGFAGTELLFNGEDSFGLLARDGHKTESESTDSVQGYHEWGRTHGEGAAFADDSGQTVWR